MLAYLRLIPYAIIIALAFAFLLQRGATSAALRTVDTLQSQVSERDRYIEQANGVITRQGDEIAEMKAQAERDGAMIVALNATIARVQDAADETLNAIKQAGKDDATVDDWLAQRVPDRVRDQLNKAAARH